MNRNQRRFGRLPPKRNDNEGKVKVSKTKHGPELEEVLSPKRKRIFCNTEKPTNDRCCYFSPDQRDFGQLTETDRRSDKYSFYPEKLDDIGLVKQLENIINNKKLENSSQYANSEKKPAVPAYVKTTDGSHWQNINSTNELDKFIHEKEKVIPKQSLQSIHISEVPRIKIIAEKFSKCKTNNIELRKLDEKVVCVEYDIYTGNNMLKPRQTMRAFFSIKPACINQEEKENAVPSTIPSKIKHTFNIADEDLKHLNDKEIEMIDGNIVENKSYLDDLKRILKRNQVTMAKKSKPSLDLRSLYEMAKKQIIPLTDFTNSNLLSSAELEEIKDLILRNCTSSVHGIRRRTVKSDAESEVYKEIGVLSRSLIAELMREDKN
ncbi:uncharacterized protein LOC131850915 isoform X2 [Achroia grisella]|uniref:uncharacterized protein LOC131850915 isoform X2 n=1 Tax=Achroia grisella TaxID=688607 RepID=UPI0027D27BEE|nr:uncharacterized protein LOC131850915 isoform X2 [Achroia grisella]